MPPLPLHTGRSEKPHLNPETVAIPDLADPSTNLDASKNAREIIRLLQCPRCSHPLQQPVALPCGNAICRKCIPELRLRTNITYPTTPNRLQGFTCPIGSCGKEHAAGDYGLDVKLDAVMDATQNIIQTHRASPEAAQGIIRVEEDDVWSVAGIPSMREEPIQAKTTTGGRLIAAYTLAETGALAHDAEVKFTTMSPTSQQTDLFDILVLSDWKEAIRPELECNVCYTLLLDPFTTPCGHTLCRTCLHRIQDHSNSCPICRRLLALVPGVSQIQAPSNVVLTKIIEGFYAEALTLRMETAKLETISGQLDTPLFICTVTFPAQPLPLHIFEPRYRLMIRRAMESNRKFGMIMGNRNREVQGELGEVPFYQYGTMLYIEEMQVLPDGRSIIVTRGISRFKILKYGSVDGYMVGKVERVDDISVAEEEAIEAAETSSITRHFSAKDHFGAPPHHPSEKPSLQFEDLQSVSTQELYQIAVDFVHSMRAMSAPWLRHSLGEAYGVCPEDPADFTWWFASIIPISSDAKYSILEMTTVRERLKMCVLFAAELERRRWSTSSNGCTFL